MRTETEPKTEVFLAKPTKTDRRQNFWNRNNTTVDACNGWPQYAQQHYFKARLVTVIYSNFTV